ncbi:cytidylyltransferase domain-containing protein [Roseibium aggregatum]|uniref:cytidylyltransferase domain-containing protein n=1 Tax=Roseibium aggregatum TaxID=187304 RepID=UPI00094AF2CD|nr:glycosyltransferase family protein [Roseibium aggregatum]
MTVADAIIQARTCSTRLPGKVMLEIEGKSVLSHVCERVSRARSIKRVILALPDTPEDDALAAHARSLTDYVYRGSETDVLDRYYQAARRFGSTEIFRITSDCPLIDPEIVDNLHQSFQRARPDYMSNMIMPGLPRGLDAELFEFRSLERAWQEARQPHEREHVTPYIYQNPDLFDIKAHEEPIDRTNWRWTLDTDADFAFITAVYEALYKPGQQFGFADIESLLLQRPDLVEINAHVSQKIDHLI